MASVDDPGIRELIEQPNCGVISTANADGSIHSAVVWVDLADGILAVNSAVGRVWPSNLERDARTTVVVFNPANPYEYVEIRGSAQGTTDGAEDQTTGWRRSTSARTPTRTGSRASSGSSS